ncbi:arginine N-succinyltransferase [Derxia gummosa]|uniref:Arginine N-succinyltransferase n=1 Tax=Derxia gummosa DSM 723 TaxID=1121388 RepID=A0A8B6XA87_9BURK|nr:arginine N-succinyltransferase [Derxia gummosa]
MRFLRPAMPADLDALLDLARQAGSGLTTLKPDRALLAERLDRVAGSFGQTLPEAERDYLFVLQDVADGSIGGVSAVRAAVGLDDAFYNYRVGSLVHSSRELGIWNAMPTLFLVNDLTGAAELCSLLLRGDWRGGVAGRLLSKARLGFIAEFRALFGDEVCAELRGYQDDDGRVPFWEGLGRCFFGMDFERADDLSARGRKSFIAELMPKYPLYLDLLPRAAREAVGRVHPATLPARKLLEAEGLRDQGYVDIFDAGPVLQARIAELRVMRHSRRLPAGEVGLKRTRARGGAESAEAGGRASAGARAAAAPAASGAAASSRAQPVPADAGSSVPAQPVVAEPTAHWLVASTALAGWRAIAWPGDAGAPRPLDAEALALLNLTPTDPVRIYRL